jgi:hypothetical protein
MRSFITPVAQFVVSKRIESIRRGPKLSFEHVGNALLGWTANGYELRDWLLAAGDDDVLSFLGFFDQPREVGLGLMNRLASLAKVT